MRKKTFQHNFGQHYTRGTCLLQAPLRDPAQKPATLKLKTNKATIIFTQRQDNFWMTAQTPKTTSLVLFTALSIPEPFVSLFLRKFLQKVADAQFPRSPCYSSFSHLFRRPHFDSSFSASNPRNPSIFLRRYTTKDHGTSQCVDKPAGI